MAATAPIRRAPSRPAQSRPPQSRPAPSRKAEPRRANLRVVRPDHRVRVVGVLGTAVVLTFFAVLFVVASLHAVLVQTQARIDAQRVENADVQAALDTVHADLARIDSPEGLEAWAISAGLVQAPEVITLVLVADGALAPPPEGDPFAGGLG